MVMDISLEMQEVNKNKVYKVAKYVKCEVVVDNAQRDKIVIITHDTSVPWQSSNQACWDPISLHMRTHRARKCEARMITLQISLS